MKYKTLISRCQSELAAAYSVHLEKQLAEVRRKNRRFKLWTRGNRGIYFDTLEAATAAAEEVRKQTGFILLITEERPLK